MKINYSMLMGSGIDPDARIVDVISWDDGEAPTYDTERARPFVEALTEIYGADHTRALLSSGWSNGYTSTKAA